MAKNESMEARRNMNGKQVNVNWKPTQVSIAIS